MSFPLRVPEGGGEGGRILESCSPEPKAFLYMDWLWIYGVKHWSPRAPAWGDRGKGGSESWSPEPCLYGALEFQCSFVEPLEPCKRLFPNCLEPPYQNVARCTSLYMKISFICMWLKTPSKTSFHMKGCAPSLAFIGRLKAIRKWPRKWPIFSPSPGAWNPDETCPVFNENMKTRHA